MAADHLRQALNPELRQKIVEVAVNELQHETFDAIVCTGVSGLLVAPAVAEALGKYLIVVRKEGEQCHSYNMVEAPDDMQCACVGVKWVFLDDLIDGGDTFHHVFAQMDRYSPFSECAGLYMYRQVARGHAQLKEIMAVHKVILNNSQEYDDAA
jgi:adenine/guanine phosphoribosyltransferase-like PRPP-binding protein